jgi:hypothetical protein
MGSRDQVWVGDWRARIMSRIRRVGCETVMDYLARFPASPYIHIAEQLGDDVAALQLEWIQFGEAKDENRMRYVAMDSLARDLHRHLPNGWRHSARDDFETASVFGTWATRLEQSDPGLESRTKSVWDALEAVHPPVGWIASGPDDPLIVAAFEKAWPEQES